MAPPVYESDPMVVCDTDDDNESVVVHDANEQDQVVVDDEEEEDDPFEKEMLVKRLHLFFMVRDSGDKQEFFRQDGNATREFCKIIDNIERIRIIGMAINMSERKIKPSLVKTCDKLI